jgi:hypothetical protein
MAYRRGAPPLPLRLRRLLRSPISRCACLIVALTALLVLLSLRQIARVDLPRPDPPHQHQVRFLMSSLHFCLLVQFFPLEFVPYCFCCRCNELLFA